MRRMNMNHRDTKTSQGKALLTLIRYPNLLYILLAIWLTQYGMVEPMVSHGLGQTLGWFHFTLLSLSIVCLAAAGYIINDYFDVNIDLVNKPDMVIIDRYINRRWAIGLHTLFNILGVGIGVYLSLKVGHAYLFLFQVVSSLLLWGYSTNYKRKVLSGNVIVSLLTACSILAPFVFQPGIWPQLAYRTSDIPLSLFQLGLAYILFAFLISMIREIIKDLEDVPGDSKEGCRTLPIVYGLNAARDWVIALSLLLLILVLLFQGIFIVHNTWMLPVYLLLTVDLPLILLIVRISKAVRSKDYKLLSRFVKVLMLAGILSILLLRLM